MSRLASVIGARVREARLAKGWSQSELARRVGTQRPNISRLERASAGGVPTITLLWAVTSAVGTTLSDLLAGIETLTESPRVASPEPTEPVLLYARRMQGMRYSVAPTAVGCYREDYCDVRVAIVEVAPFAAGRVSTSVSTETVRVVDGVVDAPGVPREVADDVRRLLMRGRAA